MLKIGEIQTVWELTLKSKTKIDLNKQPQLEPINGSFYKQGHFLVSISPKFNQATVIWLFGPRNGSGCIYDLQIENSKVKLKQTNYLGNF